MLCKIFYCKKKLKFKVDFKNIAGPHVKKMFICSIWKFRKRKNISCVKHMS